MCMVISRILGTVVVRGLWLRQCNRFTGFAWSSTITRVVLVVRGTASVDQESISDQPGVPRRRWMIASLLGFGVLVNYFDRVNLSVSQDALHSAFGITTVQFGYLLSAYSWTYALMQLPSGVLLDRFGVRQIGRISALLWGVASFGAASATGLQWFLSRPFLFWGGACPAVFRNYPAAGRVGSSAQRGRVSHAVR